ncbi:MAG: acyl-CoA thioesterase [Acidimicrobiales bacterium]
MESSSAQGFAVTFEVRYGEVDLQGVVFNAHYLAYCDHVSDTWLRSVGFEAVHLGWDYMVKTATLVWHRSLVLGDRFEVRARLVSRGRSSFIVAFEGQRIEAPPEGDKDLVFEATVIYVGVDPITHEPMPMPRVLVDALTGQSPHAVDNAIS